MLCSNNACLSVSGTNVPVYAFDNFGKTVRCAFWAEGPDEIVPGDKRTATFCSQDLVTWFKVNVDDIEAVHGISLQAWPQFKIVSEDFPGPKNTPFRLTRTPPDAYAGVSVKVVRHFFHTGVTVENWESGLAVAKAFLAKFPVSPPPAADPPRLQDLIMCIPAETEDEKKEVHDTVAWCAALVPCQQCHSHTELRTALARLQDKDAKCVGLCCHACPGAITVGKDTVYTTDLLTMCPDNVTLLVGGCNFFGGLAGYFAHLQAGKRIVALGEPTMPRLTETTYTVTGEKGQVQLAPAKSFCEKWQMAFQWGVKPDINWEKQVQDIDRQLSSATVRWSPNARDRLQKVFFAAIDRGATACQIVNEVLTTRTTTESRDVEKTNRSSDVIAARFRNQSLAQIAHGAIVAAQRPQRQSPGGNSTIQLI